MDCKSLIDAIVTTPQQHQCFSNSTVAQENGKKLTLKNPEQKKVCKVKVDKCLITSDKKKKCDYMFQISGNPNKYILVELKGADIKTAAEQIIATYDEIKLAIGAPASDYKGIIISSSVPGSEQAFRKLQDQFKKNME